jgi:hypothetical protein
MTDKNTAKESTITAEWVTSNAKALADKAVEVANAGVAALPFDVPKIDVPKLELPKFELPEFDVPKVELPGSVTELTDRGRSLVQDSMKSAQDMAGSVRKNVSETVIIAREVVGI